MCPRLEAFWGRGRRRRRRLCRAVRVHRAGRGTVHARGLYGRHKLRGPVPEVEYMKVRASEHALLPRNHGCTLLPAGQVRHTYAPFPPSSIDRHRNP